MYEANHYFGQTSCCQNPGTAQCNNSIGGWPQYSQYSFTASMTDGTPLTFANIQNQIYCSNKRSRSRGTGTGAADT